MIDQYRVTFISNNLYPVISEGSLVLNFYDMTFPETVILYFLKSISCRFFEVTLPSLVTSNDKYDFSIRIQMKVMKVMKYHTQTQTQTHTK